MTFTTTPLLPYSEFAAMFRREDRHKTAEQLAEEARLQTFRHYRQFLILATDTIEQLAEDFTEREFSAEDSVQLHRASSLIRRCVDEAIAVRLDWFEGRVEKAEGGVA